MRKGFAGSAATGVFLIAFTGILVLVNVVAAHLPPFRIDLTSNRQYSLSDATRNIVGRLGDRVKVEAFFTKDPPAPYNHNAAYVRDLLEEYSAYSKGNLVYEFVDPGADPLKKQEAAGKRVTPVQIQEYGRDRMGIKQAFMGIAVTCGGKTETIPVVRQTDDLEYELTGAIRKLTTAAPKTIAFAAGHGEPMLQDRMRRLKHELEKNHKVITHDFNTAKGAPDNVSTLVVAGPSSRWSDEHLYYLDQFIMRGGTAAFFLTNVQADMQRLAEAGEVDHGLYDLLRFYGIAPGKDLIVDPQCERIAMEAIQGGVRTRNIVDYPYFPRIMDVDRKHVLTKEMKALTLRFMSSLDVIRDNPDISYAVLARTSKQSWRETGKYAISPTEAKTAPADAARGPFNAAVAADGKFPGYFAARAKTEELPFIEDPARILPESVATRILVVGDSSLVMDTYANAGNLVFAVNAIDWLAQEPEMIAIRNRGMRDRPISSLSPGVKNLLRHANTFGIPFVFVLLGFAWMQRRKSRLRNFRF